VPDEIRFIGASGPDHQFLPARASEGRHSHAQLGLAEEALGFSAEIQDSTGIRELIAREAPL